MAILTHIFSSLLPFPKFLSARRYHKVIDHPQQTTKALKETKAKDNASRAYAPTKRSDDHHKICARRRLFNELTKLGDHYVSHCSFGLVHQHDPFHLQAIIIGPSGTPFQDGIFFLTIHIPSQYPFKPPTIKFQTKVFHPNVASDGTIQIDILSTNWTPALTIEKLLLSICSFLPDPNHEKDGCNPVCDLYWNHRKRYDDIAREWTVKYAML